MKPVHSLTAIMVVPLTAIVKSLAIATSKGIWTSRKLHAGDTFKVDHLRAEGAIRQSFHIRNSHPVQDAFASAEQTNRLHLFLDGQFQLMLSGGDSKTEEFFGGSQFGHGEGLIGEDQSQYGYVRTEQ